MTHNECPDGISLGRFVSIIHRNHIIYLNRSLKPFALSYGQFPVLMFISNNPDISQDTLSKVFCIDKGAIARAVGKLESSGMINRVIDPENRRAVKLSLTKKGEMMLTELIKVEHTWETDVFSGFSSDEKDTILKYMNQMTEKIISSYKSEVKNNFGCNLDN